MNKILLITIALCGSMAQAEYVNPYLKQDGTYVDSYYRTKADDSVFNNAGYRQDSTEVPAFKVRKTTISPYPTVYDFNTED